MISLAPDLWFQDQSLSSSQGTEQVAPLGCGTSKEGHFHVGKVESPTEERIFRCVLLDGLMSPAIVFTHSFKMSWNPSTSHYQLFLSP